MKYATIDLGEQIYYGGQQVTIANAATEFSSIWIPAWEGTARNINTLSHELNHACFRLFGRLGIKVRAGKKNEAFCYTQGDLLEQAMKSLNKETP